MTSSRIRIPFQELAIATATAQISSLVFCLAWSIKFNFHESTATHCRVPNYLPSLSATLDFTPQRDVWRAFIGLTSPPRYFIAYLYYKIIFRSKVLLFLHWIEVTALIGLSIVDSIRYFGKYSSNAKCKRAQSRENQTKKSSGTETNLMLLQSDTTAFHATCVGIFLLTSIVHMSLVSADIIGPQAKTLSGVTKCNLSRTRLVKQKIAAVNFLAIIVALYLYDRHNRYCEPGVYSMFSFLEYIVIVANVVYHLQAYYDLSDHSIVVCKDQESSSSLISNSEQVSSPDKECQD